METIEEIKPGDWIMDDRGRQGIVTQVRADGFFARPDDRQYIVDDTAGLTGVAGAKIITATFWARQDNGSYRGVWFDSPRNDWHFIFAFGEGK